MNSMKPVISGGSSASVTAKPSMGGSRRRSRSSRRSRKSHGGSRHRKRRSHGGSNPLIKGGEVTGVGLTEIKGLITGSGAPGQVSGGQANLMNDIKGAFKSVGGSRRRKHRRSKRMGGGGPGCGTCGAGPSVGENPLDLVKIH